MKKHISIMVLAIFGATLVLPSNLGAAVDTNTVNYLNNQQKNDAWVIMALKASGSQVSANQLTVDLDNATDIERTILGVVAGGGNPYNFKGTDLIAKLDGKRINNQIGSTNLLNDDIWGILAYKAANINDQRVEESKNFLLNNQNSDGGWSHQKGKESDSNDTAMAITALIRAGVNRNNGQIQNAFNYLRGLQNSDGGFPNSAGFESDSASTAWVIGALQAASMNTNAWQKNGNDPFNFLAKTKANDGSYKWKVNDTRGSAIMTSYAAIALAGTSYPVASYSGATENNRVNNVNTTPTNVNQNNSGGQRVSVKFRIEGKSKNICTGETHASDALDLVKQAARQCNFSYILESTNLGPYLKQIGNDKAEGSQGWLYLVNWQQPSIAADQYQLKANDYITWYYGEFDWPSLKLTHIASSKSGNGEKVQFQVQAYNQNNWYAPKGVQVRLMGGQAYTVDNGGNVMIDLNRGSYVFYAESPGFVRSDTFAYTVGNHTLQKNVPLVTKVIQPPKPQPQPSNTASAPIVSFEVVFKEQPGNYVQFGQLEPNQKSSQIIQLKNNSDISLNFSATVTGDRLFVDNLRLDNNLWSRYTKNVAAKQQQDVNVELTVPSDYQDEGHKNGELIFWAKNQLI